MKKFKQFVYRKLVMIRAFIEYLHDYRRHVKYYRIYKDESKYTKGSLLCSILIINHQLEKAQTYENAKEGYGQDKIYQLLSLVKTYLSSYSINDTIRTSFAVIESHFKNRSSFKDEKIRLEFKLLEEKYDLTKPEDYGGVFKYNPENYKEQIEYDALRNFFESRRSCRIYAQDTVEIEDITKAIEVAQSAPSACNRQTTRVHVYQKKIDIENIIRAQKSDVDWCLSANVLFVITTDLFLFRDTRERNQGMFDSGLFSMNLVHALHSLGIGSCFKMAQKGTAVDNNTLKVAGIPKNEEINVLILAGKYKGKDTVVAKSIRIGCDEVMTIHK